MTWKFSYTCKLLMNNFNIFLTYDKDLIKKKSLNIGFCMALFLYHSQWVNELS